MLIIKVQEGEKIDKALKRYKRKFRNTKIQQELRDRKQYTKPSVRKREETQKARYKEQVIRAVK